MEIKNNVQSNLIKDRVFMGLILMFSILSMIPLILILYYIFVKGDSGDQSGFPHKGIAAAAGEMSILRATE